MGPVDLNSRACHLPSCQKFLVRKRKPNGSLESVDKWEKRKYCDDRCYRTHARELRKSNVGWR